MKCYKITQEEAHEFLIAKKVWRELIGIYNADYWIAVKDNQRIVGVCSMIKFKKMNRISTFYIEREHRRKGLGSTLIEHMLFKEKEFTIFATESCKNLLLKYDFEIIKKKSNGDYFMKRGDKKC